MYNDTLIRDYAGLFYYYTRLYPYTRLCAIILLLYAIIFTTIFPIVLRLFHDYTRLFCDYLHLFHGISTRRMGICRQQFLTQSWRNDWLVSMKNACSSALTGRRADRMESWILYYYTHYFFYCTHYLSWLNRIVTMGSISTSYALCFYAHPF